MQLALAGSDLECSLSIGASPLEYQIVSRSVSVRVRFSSNCSPMKEFLLMGFFSFDRKISKSVHPKRVKLEIGGRKYNMDFSEPENLNLDEVSRKISYIRMEVSPGARTQKVMVGLRKMSHILLPDNGHPFNYEELRAINQHLSPIECKVSKSLREIACKI